MEEQGSSQGVDTANDTKRDLQGFVSATKELRDACSGEFVTYYDLD